MGKRNIIQGNFLSIQTVGVQMLQNITYILLQSDRLSQCITMKSVVVHFLLFDLAFVLVQFNYQKRFKIKQ